MIIPGLWTAFLLLWEISPFCLGGVLSAMTAWGRGQAIFPAGQGVNGLLCPRSLLGCVWLSPLYALLSLAPASCLWYRLQVRQKCDKSHKTASSATVCAPVLYALPISYGCIMSYPCPCYGWVCSVFTTHPPIPPLMGERYLIPTLYTRVSVRLTTPTQKSVSIDTSGDGVNLPDCTDLCNRLKIERVSMSTKLSVFQLRPFARSS